MEIYIMAIRSSGTSGVPFGGTAGRPANAANGQPYFNGDIGRLELFTSATGWQNIVQETPGVSGITGTYSETANSGTITISGTNFVSGAYASAIGSNGVEVIASSTTYNSLVQITAIFTNLSNANEPYDIKVTNPSNLFGMIPDALYINATPVWTTSSGSLGIFAEQVNMSVSATATDSDSTITYSLASGSSLPSGITLNSSTGAITGTLPDVATNTTYNFTINASDGVNAVVPRSFSFVSNAAPVWNTASGSLGTFVKQTSISTSAFSTTDTDSVTYSLASGSSLPSGLTLNSSTGVISGTLPNISSETTYSFTINASDGVNTIPRAFSITSILPITGRILMVAGGGGGGSNGGEGGGGGAGGLLYYGTETPKTVNGSEQTFSPGTTYTITVGSGGRGADAWTPPNSANGTNSSLTGGSLSLSAAVGGGAGGCYPLHTEPPYGNGLDGGSGGGGGGNSSGNSSPYRQSGGGATANQGNAGGYGFGGGSPFSGGGGGGSGAAGQNATDNNAGNGGDGLYYSITGSSVAYAGGGGGCQNVGALVSSGGAGGGGAGGYAPYGDDGAANTGGGGGGGSTAGQLQNGGSGVVILSLTAPAVSVTGSPVQSTPGGRYVYKFNNTGSITF